MMSVFFNQSRERFSEWLSIFLAKLALLLVVGVLVAQIVVVQGNYPLKHMFIRTQAAV
jgi:hypothetical protein